MNALAVRENDDLITWGLVMNYPPDGEQTRTGFHTGAAAQGSRKFQSGF